MGEAGALARARGASERRGLCRAVKQRAPGLAMWWRGSRKSGQERWGRLVEGREGRGRGHRPEDAHTEERV